MNINVKTGLPELPEDYYWKVTKKDIDMGTDVDAFLVGPRRELPTLSVELWHTSGAVRAGGLSPLYRDLADWESADIYSDEEETLRAAGYTPTTLTKGTSIFSRLRQDWVRLQEPTQENIVQAANRVAEQFYKYYDRQKANEKAYAAKSEVLDQFVGEYPPNNLKETV